MRLTKVHKAYAIGAVAVVALAYASFETFAMIMSKLGKNIEVIED